METNDSLHSSSPSTNPSNAADLALKGLHIHFLRTRQNWNDKEAVEAFISKIVTQFNSTTTDIYHASHFRNWDPEKHRGFYARSCYSIRPSSGHYRAFCRTPDGWRQYDDSTVEACTDDEILKEANRAYILCFKKDNQD